MTNIHRFRPGFPKKGPREKKDKRGTLTVKKPKEGHDVKICAYTRYSGNADQKIKEALGISTDSLLSILAGRAIAFLTSLNEVI